MLGWFGVVEDLNILVFLTVKFKDVKLIFYWTLAPYLVKFEIENCTSVHYAKLVQKSNRIRG